MEQIKKFLHGRGFALALIACLLAAAAAGIWAVRTLRAELEHSLDGLQQPESSAQETLPGVDEPLNTQEDEPWQDLEVEPAANSAANVPQPASSASSSSSGALSGSGSVSEPPALHTESASEGGSAAPAATQPFSGRVLNAYSGDELVYSKTLGDWRTHNGVDYACKQGEEVCAPVAGKVISAGADGNWGSVVELEDSTGRLWRICGAADPRVKAGDTVTAGQALAKVGSIGCECSEESHIHLEVKQGEQYLDPAKELN